MRKIAVFTTFHKNGYINYGKRMIKSFDKHWPEDINLYVYCEDVQPTENSDRIIYKDLHESCPALVNFKKRHKNNPLAHGQDAAVIKQLHKTGQASSFSPNKQFKYLAIRFSHKVYAMYHAMNTIDADVIIWLDADSYTFEKIPMEFLQKAIGKLPVYCTYIGRPGNKGKSARKWSECGFMAYNINHPEHKKFHNRFISMYNEDTLFNWQEWHDSWLFDRVREYFEYSGMENQDLNLTGNKRHPFVNTILGKYIDHLKGDHRKKEGKSNISKKDVIVKHTNKYWKK